MSDLVPPFSDGREPGWFDRSSWADADWKRAQAAYWDERCKLGYPWRPNPDAAFYDPARAQAAADARLRAARVDYRTRILSWYAKLCLPLEPGSEVPNAVARLMWEQWDIDGTDAADAVNL